MPTPLDRLRHHVTGAIERGEAAAITEQPTMQLDQMLEAYLTCAIWADLRDDDGEPIEGYSIDEFADDALTEARTDCELFLTQASALLGEWNATEAGHDFWLTRNGHGAGFWDHGRANGEALTAIAKTYPIRSVYVTDAGKLEFDLG